VNSFMALRRHSRTISFALLIMTLLGVYTVALRPRVIVAETRFDTLDRNIGSLVGTDLRFDESVYDVLNADANLLRAYRSSEGDGLWLYIGYYGTAKGGRASHLPQFCYTGQGWSIEKWDLLDLDPSGATRINRMLVKQGARRQLVYFWFQSESAIMATGIEQNWYKFQHRLLYNRNDGAFVRISLDVPKGQDALIEEQARTFSLAVMPMIASRWPIEKPAVF
jgi:EpsI family protein